MFNIPGFPTAVLIKSDPLGLLYLKETPLGRIAGLEYGVQRQGGKHGLAINLKVYPNDLVPLKPQSGEQVFRS